MGINYDPKKEEDSFNAASVNDAFDAFAGSGKGLNALEKEDFEIGSFRAEHLPSLIDSTAFPTLSTNGNIAAYSTSNTYQNDFGASGPFNYQTFSTAAPSAPYGPSTASTRDGWRIVAHNSVSADAAEISFTATDLTDIKGILVRASVAIGVPAGGSLPSSQRDTVYVAIGFEDSLGNRYCVERSMRPYSIGGVFHGAADTHTFLTAQDLTDLSAANVTSVFLLIAGHELTGSAVANVTTEGYNIDILPVFGGDL